VLPVVSCVKGKDAAADYALILPSSTRTITVAPDEGRGGSALGSSGEHPEIKQSAVWCSGGRIFLAVCAVQVAAFYTAAEVPSYPFNIQLFAGFCLRLYFSYL